MRKNFILWSLIIRDIRQYDVPKELQTHDKWYLIQNWNVPEVDCHRNWPYHPVYYQRLPNLLIALSHSLFKALRGKVIYQRVVYEKTYQIQWRENQLIC